MCAKAGAYCAGRGVELGKLSVYWSIHNLEHPAAITLLGVGNMNILRINMEIIHHGLNTTEKEVMDEVIEKFFEKIDKKKTSWENIEIREYNKALGNIEH